MIDRQSKKCLSIAALSQFVISIIVDDACSDILSKLFMEQVVVSFVMVAVAVVDAGSTSLNLFAKILSVRFYFLDIGTGQSQGQQCANAP